MKEITLSKGYVTQVDDKEYERCMEGPKWCAHETKYPDGSIRNMYAIRSIRLPNGKRTTQQMHRFILGVTDPKVDVDHEDHNGLNNQRSNLRVATHAQNIRNQRLRIVNVSGFKGVSWHKAGQKWQANIRVEGKQQHLGLFTNAEQAALAYDTAALLYHGEFAYTNQVMKEAA